MYLDPADYDPFELTGEELVAYQGWSRARAALDEAFGQVITEYSFDERTPVFSGLMRELRESVRASITELMEISETEFICSLMESNPEKYCDKD